MRLLSHNQNYLPFLSRVINGESLRRCHLIIILRARSIITIIISTSRRLLRRTTLWIRGEATKARLSTSDSANPGVHLTHLKTTIKIISHELKLIQNGRKRCLYSRRKRWSRRRRGSRGIDNILSSSKLNLFLLSRSRFLMRPLSLGHKVCSSSDQRFLANITHNPKER